MMETMMATIDRSSFIVFFVLLVGAKLWPGVGKILAHLQKIPTFASRKTLRL